MRHQNYFLAGILLLFTIGVVLLPDRRSRGELDPEALLERAVDDYWFVSTDEVAEQIIFGDPTIRLIDVRTTDQYETYSIPGAINIPLAEILQPEWQDLLEMEGMNFIFYSNSDLLASQAWMICTRTGIKNIAIMKGGINRWVETILQPKPPPSTAPGEAFALYQFRKGASIYFGGGMDITTEITGEPLPLVRKKKKTVVSGGC